MMRAAMAAALALAIGGVIGIYAASGGPNGPAEHPTRPVATQSPVPTVTVTATPKAAATVTTTAQPDICLEANQTAIEIHNALAAYDGTLSQTKALQAKIATAIFEEDGAILNESEEELKTLEGETIKAYSDLFDLDTLLKYQNQQCIEATR